MQEIMRQHEKISKQYAQCYISTLGVDGCREPSKIYSLTKLERMRRLRDESVERVICARYNKI